VKTIFNWSIRCFVLLWKNHKWFVWALEKDFKHFGYIRDQSGDFCDDL